MSVLEAVWLMKEILAVGVPMTKGVMSVAGMVGALLMVVVGARHWALMVVPWGMDAIRDSDSPNTGSTFVAGTCIQRPGSK